MHSFDYQDGNHLDIYVMALYWAVATFLTVGYGKQ